MSDEVKTRSFRRTWRLPRPSLYALGDHLRPMVDRIIMRGSLLPDRAVQDSAVMPWIAALERDWQTVRDEALAIVGQTTVPSLRDVSPDHGRIAADRRWKSFFLYGYGYGYRIHRNCEQAPNTAGLIKAVPGIVSAFFSVLEPGCHIPRHRGVTKAILNYHLALKVPAPQEECRMELAGRVLHWQESRGLLFDDTFHHEVWNETAGERIVLLIQVRRPCRGTAWLLQELFLWGIKRSRFVQDVRRRLAASGADITAPRSPGSAMPNR